MHYYFLLLLSLVCGKKTCSNDEEQLKFQIHINCTGEHYIYMAPISTYGSTIYTWKSWPWASFFACLTITLLLIIGPIWYNNTVMERCPSGLRSWSWKPVMLNGTVGSNPTLSAISPDSSVGRAGDWKSPCRWFDSASGHQLKHLLM